MLGLKLPTDPRWTDIASKNLAEILTDHAYCEQKAASSCISLIIQFPEKSEMVETVTPIVTEEWGHFRRVLRELALRSIPFGKPRKDEYVLQLQKLIRKGGNRNQQLVERLLHFALIEARSCERFKILSQEIEEQSLRSFYYDFMVSEAEHYVTFVNLAKGYMPIDYVNIRWQEFLSDEANIIQNLALHSRIH